MDKHDPIISALRQEIDDERLINAVIEKNANSGRGIINILREENLIGEEQLTRIIASSNKIEFVNLSPDMVEPIAAHMVTSQIANQYNLIPIKKVDNNLFVAMSDPLNLVVRDQIELRTGFKVIPLAATPNAIRGAIRHHFDVRNATRQAIASMRLKRQDGESGPESSSSAHKALQVADDPVSKLVYSIITGAVDARASDIHIEPQESDMRVRYRIDGLLHNTLDVPASVQQEVISHIKILADMDISERRLPQDGHIAIEHDNRNYDLRVSSLPAVGGEKIVIRILDKNMDRWSLEKIVTSSDNNKKFRSLVRNPYGMILLTGPTGSGKTTTLYALLQLLNTPEKNIVTVEDPVEYRLEGITQVQVRPSAGRTFATALRSILRQDPDIVLIGEIRDYETAEIAVSAALTGHLVLSTLHTNDAAGAISRLINIGIPPFLIASALLGTVAQRLIRTICPKCRQSYKPSSEDMELISDSSQEDSVVPGTSKTGAIDKGRQNKNGKKDKEILLYRGQGCEDCYGTGYSGRRAIYEILCVSREIRQLIINAESDEAIKQQAIAQNMKTLREDGIEQILTGKTSLEELLRVVDMRSD
ncbi:MAG: type II/IV secretion system protein [Sedimentisphaerales bacterium]|nr:type II/IV secretion system protein [Sedimentisphaerales bacterium]